MEKEEILKTSINSTYKQLLVCGDMNAKIKAEAIVDKMMSKDSFSQWLGISVVSVEPGTCILKMIVKSEMLNGFQIAHGGICYAFADSALAFASNGYGIQALSIETSISHTKVVHLNDELTATATEENLSSRFGIYHVTVQNQKNEVVALFKGTVYRTDKNWEI